MTLRALVPGLVCLALLTTAACGREATVAGDATSPTETAAAGTGAAAWDPATTAGDAIIAESFNPDAVKVRLLDHSIEMPATIPAGETTFQITNLGKERHNFEIEGEGIDRALESVLEPGQSRSLTVNLEPGTYRIWCPYANHAEEHVMSTQLTVE